ncbi:MAG TPA: hypothetical protein VFL67_10895 [Mycobacterium sp.]|nr:hypothetical protein [Mycobacterium sp.]
MLSTTDGASVSVVKAPGTSVWRTLFPNDSLGPDTETIESHDLLVVLSNDSVPQGLRRTRPGDEPLVIDTVQLVIDSTDGKLIATTTSTPDESAALRSAQDALGTATMVAVN